MQMIKELKRKTSKKGFTLLELLAVLVILAALSTIAIPIFTNKSSDAKQLAHNANVQLLQMQAQQYLLQENIALPQTNIIDKLVEKGYIKEIPTNPLGAPAYVVRVDAGGVVTVEPGLQYTNAPINNSELVYAETFADDTNKGPATTADWRKGSLTGEEREILNNINNLGGTQNDLFEDIIQDRDGNYICVGISGSNLSIISGESVNGANTQGSYDFVIAKFNSSLQLIAINNLGGTSGDYFYSIIQDSDGNYVCVGESGSNLSTISGESINGANTQGSYDFVIAKFNTNLQLIAINNLGGASWDSFNSIIQDSDGNYICIGASDSNLSTISGESVNGANTQGDDDFVIAKFNSNLQLIAINNLGGASWESFNSIIQDSDGNYVCVGSSDGNLSTISGESVSGANTQGGGDFVIAKFNSSLQLIAINNLGGAGVDYLNSIIQDSDGNYVCVGYSDSNLSTISGESVSGANTQGDIDFVIAKFNSNLQLTAINSLGGTLGDYFSSIIQDSDGNYVCIGESSSNLSTISGESVNGANTQGYSDFVIAKFNTEATYIPSNNILVSKEINLGTSLTNIKIKVDATVPSGTSYIFQYSTDGSSFTTVPNASLNGNTSITIPSSSSIWWKITLTGDTTTSPRITGVTVYK